MLKRFKALLTPFTTHLALWLWLIILIQPTLLSHYPPGQSSTPAPRPRLLTTQTKANPTRTSMLLQQLVQPSTIMQASSHVLMYRFPRAEDSMTMAGMCKLAMRWLCHLLPTPLHPCSQLLLGMKSRILPIVMPHTARCPSTTGLWTTLVGAIQSVIL